MVFVFVLVLALWAGMMTVMDTSSRSRMTRFLRRWAGLPTPGTGTRTGATGTSLTGTGGSGTGGSIDLGGEPTAPGTNGQPRA